MRRRFTQERFAQEEKKLKHLAVTNTVCDYIGDKIKENKKVTNTEIRRALAEFCEKSRTN